MHRSESGHVHGERSMPCGRDVRHVDRRMLEPREGQRHCVQRRQCVHADRHVPIRSVLRRQSGDMRRGRSVPCCGHVRYVDRRLFQPCEGGRNELHRRQRVHANGHLPGRRMQRREPRDVPAERPVPRRRRVQCVDRNVLESAEGERQRMQRWECVHADRHVPGRDLLGIEPRHVRGERSVPHRGIMRYVDGGLLQSRKAKRDDLQRRKRVHAE